MPPTIGHTAPADLIALSASARRVLESMLRVADDHPDLDWARRALDEVADRLDAIGVPGDDPRIGPQGGDDFRPYYFPGDTDQPVRAATPYMTAEQDGAARRGRVRFDLTHEGPPGWVHGGHVAWFHDMVLGLLMMQNEIYAPTRKIEVHYRRPTPVLTELQYEAELERREGREAFARIRLMDGDTLVSEAVGHFVVPRDRR